MHPKLLYIQSCFHQGTMRQHREAVQRHTPHIQLWHRTQVDAAKQQ